MLMCVRHGGMSAKKEKGDRRSNTERLKWCVEKYCELPKQMLSNTLFDTRFLFNFVGSRQTMKSSITRANCN